jgi:hypothetical protein
MGQCAAVVEEGERRTGQQKQGEKEVKYAYGVFEASGAGVGQQFYVGRSQNKKYTYEGDRRPDGRSGPKQFRTVKKHKAGYEYRFEGGVQFLILVLRYQEQGERFQIKPGQQEAVAQINGKYIRH